MAKLVDYAEDLKKFQDLYSSIEELDPELAEFYTEGEPFPMIRHPLVYSIMHHPIMNKQVNLSLKHKKERIAELEAAGEFDKIIGYYERPYRIDAFAKYSESMTDEQYWKTLGWIWTDTENFHQNADSWREALTSHRPGSNSMMDEDDLAFFESLPEEVTIYRGQSKKYAPGWSWTTVKATAVWFAKRFQKEDSFVYTGRVKKTSILAAFVGRGESEVVVDEEFVQIIAQEEV